MDIIISFRPDVSVDMLVTGQIEICDQRRLLTLKNLSAALRAVIDTLSGAGGSEGELVETVCRQGETSDISRFYYYLKRLDHHGWLVRSVLFEGSCLARSVPIAESAASEAGLAFAADSAYVLSRFAYCRVLDGETTLESPLSTHRIIFGHWLGLAMVGLLAAPVSLRQLAAAFPQISVAAIEGVCILLLAAGFIQPTDSAGNSDESQNDSLQQWEFHDLLFHSRSRWGRNDMPAGGTFRFRGQIEPLPACRPPASDDVITLFQPDIEELKNEDYPFSLIVEERRSVREYASQPLSLQQLGEFLYRTARVKQLHQPDISQGRLYQCSQRPYPSGGAMYALELYLAVKNCQGLPPGLYRYEPLRHQLEKIVDLTPAVEQVIQEAQNATDRACTPQVLITMTARFQRTSWKYQSIAYSLILKEVGALYQTMYLVATAMDLAPCAIGSGHSDRLAQAAGLDYLIESAVGEFLLGSKRI